MTSASALEALEVMGLFQPDVLVSDIVMPNVDGYSLIRRIRHDGSPNKDIPAIAVTSLDTEETLDLAIKSGFQAFLIKPVEPDDFAELILSLYLEGSACNESRIS
jgi:CheY-like chemotaxis protein